MQGRSKAKRGSMQQSKKGSIWGACSSCGKPQLAASDIFLEVSEAKLM